jgi:hypothetical protein
MTPEQMIRELRNALIVAANNAHQRKKEINELNPNRMFYNEVQFQILVESSLNDSEAYRPDYESKNALDWKREKL